MNILEHVVFWSMLYSGACCTMIACNEGSDMILFCLIKILEQKPGVLLIFCIYESLGQQRI